MRINLKFKDLFQWEQSDYDLFSLQLNGLEKSLQAKLNILTNCLKGDRNCKSGVTEFTLAPNGKLYPCPGFYYELPNDELCVADEINKLKTMDSTLFDHSKSLKCRDCKNNQCEQCTLQNRLITGFSNLPAESLCRIFAALDRTNYA